MSVKLLLASLLVVLAVSEHGSVLRVIDDTTLRAQQKNPKLRLTPFSPGDRNVVLYRRLRVAQPFDACSALQPIGKDPDSFFILADGAGCSYRQKAHYAMNAGAHGIIIIDDEHSRKDEPYIKFHDGIIYSFLIDEDEGKLISNYLKSNKKTDVEVLVQYQKNNTKRHVELWMSPMDERSYIMAKWWKEILDEVPSLQKQMTWKPRYAITGCIMNSQNPARKCDTTTVVQKSCACNGQLCSPYEASTTQIVILEDIRQKYIFMKYPQSYFDYLSQVKDKCLQKYKREKNMDKCSRGVAQGLKINSSYMQQAVTEVARQCSNSLFNAMIDDKYHYSYVNQFPSLAVDKKILNFNDKYSMKISVCQTFNMLNDPGCLANPTVTQGTSWYFWMFLILGVLGSGFVIFLIYRRMIYKDMQKEISMQVSTAIEHYFSMNESKD